MEPRKPTMETKIGNAGWAALTVSAIIISIALFGGWGIVLAGFTSVVCLLGWSVDQREAFRGADVEEIQEMIASLNLNVRHLEQMHLDLQAMHAELQERS